MSNYPNKGDLSNVLLFWKQWREPPRTGSPSFPNSSAEMLDTVSRLSLKLLLFYVWNFILRYPSLSLFPNHRIHQNWFHQLGLMSVFPRWPVSRLLIIAKLYGIPCVTVSSSGSEILTTESSVRALSGTSWNIHLDLCSRRYNNSPQVSCLGMNPGRGWNPNLEESYLLEYSE